MYFEDFEHNQAMEFGDYHVTEKEIIEFAAKYDPQYFHLHHELAKNSLFGGLCASGWHTCAMFMRMLVDTLPTKHGSLGSPGIDQLKWHKPVYPGDRLSVKGRVLERRELSSKPHVGLVKVAYEVCNQRREVVMSLTSNAFFAKRMPR